MSAGKIVAMPARRFAWSWTRLKAWRTCPKRYYHVFIAKEFNDDTEDTLWGKTFHEAMAARISKGKPLPKELERHDRLPSLMNDHRMKGSDVRVELQLAIDDKFQPTGWFDKDVWMRGVIDVLYLTKAEAAVIDWKTGKNIKPDMEQLNLFAQLIFSHHPKVEEVHTTYWWTQHMKDTTNSYRRSDMVPFWAVMLPEVKRMEKATLNAEFPPNPSGICLHWCPVTSCPFHGKGNR